MKRSGTLRWAKIADEACFDLGLIRLNILLVTASESAPLLTTLRWLSAQVNFPASRLPDAAERLLLMSVVHEVEEIAFNASKTPIQRRENAKESAMRAHAMRRSLVHFRCDNSAKV